MDVDELWNAMKWTWGAVVALLLVWGAHIWIGSATPLSAILGLIASAAVTLAGVKTRRARRR